VPTFLDVSANSLFKRTDIAAVKLRPHTPKPGVLGTAALRHPKAKATAAGKNAPRHTGRVF
jgi:hypothetical protein